MTRLTEGVEAVRAAVTADVEAAVAGLDLARLEREYWEQDEFLFVPDFLPAPTVARLLEDVARLEPALNRNYIPRHKKGGSVSHFVIADGGPAILALYQVEAFRRWLGRLVGADLKRCPAHDPHACALYFYTEAGDHMGYHYDTSYYAGARYTVLVGLVQESSSRLLCRLHTRGSAREPRDLAVATTPGAMVVFNGDKVYHGVSPSRAGDRRVVLTLEYVTSQDMTPAKRVLSNLKDAFAYFGVRSLWQSRRRRLSSARGERPGPTAGSS